MVVIIISLCILHSFPIWYNHFSQKEGFTGCSLLKNPPANAGNSGSIPGSGRSPGEGNGNALQYSCLGNPMDRGACWVIVQGFAKSQTRLSTHTHRHAYSQGVIKVKRGHKGRPQSNRTTVLTRDALRKGHVRPQWEGSWPQRQGQSSSDANAAGP